MNLLVHGLYDVATLDTLKALDVRRFGLDLRARSPNLVPFSQLKELLEKLGESEVTLVFEDDKSSTVLSFLDLLKATPESPMLEFRDALSPEYYWSLKRPFVWMYQPEARWKEILELPNLKGVLLPLRLMEHYRDNPELWDLLEQRSLEVILHADRPDEIDENFGPDTSLSVDLPSVVEARTRKVDQERLRKLKIWSQLNASPSL